MGCTHDCSTCGHDCGSEQDFSKKLNEMSSVKKVIGVVSGKGGVGKSLVTSLLAVSMQRLGYRTAILDADITGPSIPQAFGLREKIETLGEVMLPAVSRFGTQVMSINLLLERESDPVVWRGPVIAGAVASSGPMCTGRMSILCLSICPPAPVMSLSPYSSPSPWMASSWSPRRSSSSA